VRLGLIFASALNPVTRRVAANAEHFHVRDDSKVHQGLRPLIHRVFLLERLAPLARMFHVLVDTEGLVEIVYNDECIAKSFDSIVLGHSHPPLSLS
jgi:hypothetical protein